MIFCDGLVRALLSLMIGQKLMGIPGMILAPVLLHYLKMEGSQIEVKISK